MRVVLVAGAVALAAIVGAYLVPGPQVIDGESDAAPDLDDYSSRLMALADEYTGGEGMEINASAFLAALRLGEGTAGPNGYLTLCGGTLFNDYGAHPALTGWRGLPLSDSMCAAAGFGSGCVSTAAGAFQINKPTWLRVSRKLGLRDFSPASQDAAAWELIREKGADVDVLAGRTAQAIAKVRKIWASLPGAGYGQREVALSSFNSVFTQSGGVLA